LIHHLKSYETLIINRLLTAIYDYLLDVLDAGGVPS
jgi:hypothetical protein